MNCCKSCYNFDVMNETEFIEKEIGLIEDIKSSSIYLRYKELSKMIEEDSNLISLCKERDEILMKEYRIYYEKVRRIINHLTNGLNKEIL